MRSQMQAQLAQAQKSEAPEGQPLPPINRGNSEVLKAGRYSTYKKRGNSEASRSHLQERPTVRSRALKLLESSAYDAVATLVVVANIALVAAEDHKHDGVRGVGVC